MMNNTKELLELIAQLTNENLKLKEENEHLKHNIKAVCEVVNMLKGKAIN